MSAPIGGVTWAKHHDTWERVHLCATADGARLIVNLMSVTRLMHQGEN